MGNREWGLQSICRAAIILQNFVICYSFIVTLCSWSILESQPQDAFLPELILHGLPIGCSSPSTAPICICDTGPIFHLQIVHRMQFSQAFCSMGCNSSPGSDPLESLWAMASFRSHPSSTLCSSMVRTWRSALPYAPWAVVGQSALPWDSMGCRGLLLHARSPSCPPSTLIFMFLSHFSFFSPSCCSHKGAIRTADWLGSASGE